MANAKYWIFAMVSIFGLGILYIGVIEFAIIGTVLPKFVDVVNGTTTTIPIDAATQATILTNYDNITFFLRTMPFILLLVIVIYMIVVSLRKEAEEVQY